MTVGWNEFKNYFLSPPNRLVNVENSLLVTKNTIKETAIKHLWTLKVDPDNKQDYECEEVLHKRYSASKASKAWFAKYPDLLTYQRSHLLPEYQNLPTKFEMETIIQTMGNQSAEDKEPEIGFPKDLYEYSSEIIKSDERQIFFLKDNSCRNFLSYNYREKKLPHSIIQLLKDYRNLPRSLQIRIKNYLFYPGAELKKAHALFPYLLQTKEAKRLYLWRELTFWIISLVLTPFAILEAIFSWGKMPISLWFKEWLVETPVVSRELNVYLKNVSPIQDDFSKIEEERGILEYKGARRARLRMTNVIKGYCHFESPALKNLSLDVFIFDIRKALENWWYTPKTPCQTSVIERAYAKMDQNQDKIFVKILLKEGDEDKNLIWLDLSFPANNEESIGTKIIHRRVFSRVEEGMLDNFSGTEANLDIGKLRLEGKIDSSWIELSREMFRATQE